MFSLLRVGRRDSSRRVQHNAAVNDDDDGPVPNEPSPGPASGHRRYAEPRHATADFTEADDDDDDSDGGDLPQLYGIHEDAIDDEDGPSPAAVLPLFSASYLDSLPVYNITHAIRIIVQTRTETTLTWEQLRSPQVSQFLIKPMQQQIRTQHFSRATIYALMANCLQFTKEGQRYPGNAGTSSTRAKVCELLAIKVLKEYDTRELIDALSYDFHPLQGMPGLQGQHGTSTPAGAASLTSGARGSRLSAARTSTLEVAIRASAKNFLAHPLVVQQLEAIWNGAISFYSSQDSLHREAPPSSPLHDRNRSPGKAGVRTPLLGGNVVGGGHAASDDQATLVVVPGRRTVMLYDPRRQASLFKLSRLRVPRYRSFLSTLSLAVLIGLFLAVLVRRSNKITTLELLFWFWSAGFMLDELVGFNEQGFSLYIMSFWNLFDLGILVLLIIYYCMRAYGIFLIDAHHWNDMAYDVLAANAILLLPRIFSVLDHYHYFSQLLIAFRLMAVDLAAVFVLVLISCSGFFVFFTMAKNETGASEAAYKIFQILMGFTPAAWEVWPTYNWLGRTLLVLFLIICHFLVVTILITVLTNSFMAIASNANQEHQFLFAINTISMVKNDALFSYIAPGNIFAWLLMPLRYCMPLRHFVYLNRFVIKVTHFPLLVCIYLYERYWLAPSMYEPTDLVENPGRGRGRAISFADPASRTAMFAPNVRVREESVLGFQKDRALEEVFRRVPDMNALRNQRRNERRKTQTAIRNWMDQHDEPGSVPLHWPTLESQRPLRNEWQRRHSLHRDRPPGQRQVSDVRSAASDPADLMSNSGFPLTPFRRPQSEIAPPEHGEYKDQTDADGDDEFVTNDEEEEDDNATNTADPRRAKTAVRTGGEQDYFNTPATARFADSSASLLGSPSRPGFAPSSQGGGPSARKGIHSRTLSTNTILFNPLSQAQRRPSTSSSISHEPSQPRSRPLSGRHTGGETPTTSTATAGQRSPRRSLYMAASRPRPILPPREVMPHTTTGTVPSRASFLTSGAGQEGSAANRASRPAPGRRLSSIDTNMLSDNIPLFTVGDDPTGGVPSSFQTQMAMAMMKEGRGGAGLGGGIDPMDRDRMGRLVLARMKTLEESFADVVREMRELRSSATAPTSRRGSFGDDDVRSAAAASLGGGFATIEVAGARPRRTRTGDAQKRSSLKRPVSRRSMKEGKMGTTTSSSGKDKGKGKEVAHSSGEDDADDDLDKTGTTGGDDSFTRKGSSL